MQLPHFLAHKKQFLHLVSKLMPCKLVNFKQTWKITINVTHTLQLTIADYFIFEVTECM